MFQWLTRWSGRRMARALAEVLNEEAEENFLYQLLLHVRNGDVALSYANMQRAASGEPFYRPFSHTHRPRLWDQLALVPAQLARLPREATESVDTQVTVGPKAERPMIIGTPIMVAAMATELAINLPAKLALAQGAAANRTATNAGEGGFYAEERDAAYRYILQYSRRVALTGEQIAQANMIEILIGQGAMGAISETTDYPKLSVRARHQLGIKPGGQLESQARLQRLEQPGGLRRLVEELREAGHGIPIGIKLAAGDIEADLAIAVEAGPDALIIDGGEGSTHRGPDVLIRHLGIPLPHALMRAHAFLQREGLKSHITLVAAGGLLDAGDYFKALALGADCLYSGGAVGAAMLGTGALPGLGRWAPPTQYLFHDGRLRHEFDARVGARNAANYLAASTQELALCARAMGKSRLSDIDEHDLVALTTEAAATTGLKISYSGRMES